VITLTAAILAGAVIATALGVSIHTAAQPAPHTDLEV
jgi:hypothetical protein